MMKAFVSLFLVCLCRVPNAAESLALTGKPQDLEKFGNGTYDDRFFFLQPLSSGSSTSSCATTNLCCRSRCPFATQICVTPAGELNCAATAAGPGTVKGTSCYVVGTCAACATDTTISCAGKQECTATPGGDICAPP